MKRRKKMMVFFLAIFAFLIALLFSLGPLTTFAVRTILEKKLIRNLRAEIGLERVSVSFFPPRVEIENLTIRPNEGPVKNISVAHAKIVPGAGPVFLGKVIIEKIEIEKPSVELELLALKPSSEKTGSPGTFRLPTLHDLLRVEIHEVDVRKARLLVDLPGEGVQFEIGDGSARFRGSADKERWAWNARGLIRKGDRVFPLDRVRILAERTGADVHVRTFDVEGLGIMFQARGQAYPKADLQGKLVVDSAEAEKILVSLGLLTKSLDLRGEVIVRAGAKGLWSDVKLNVSAESKSIGIRKRVFPKFVVHAKGHRDFLEEVRGEVDVNPGTLKFSVDKLGLQGAARFQVTGTKIPYVRIQEISDPGQDHHVRGNVDVTANGSLRLNPLVVEGGYRVRSDILRLELGPAVQAFLPFQFRNVDVNGKLGYRKEAGFTLPSGKLKTDGLQGEFDFRITKGPKTIGTWNAQLDSLAQVFDDELALRGRGKISGGVEALKSEYDAKIHLDLFDVGLETANLYRALGTLQFRKGVAFLRNLSLSNEESSFVVEAELPYEDTRPENVQGSWERVELGWVSKILSRKYSWLAGLKGTSTGSAKLHGSASNRSGLASIRVQNGRYRSVPFETARAEFDFMGRDVLIQQGRVEGKNFLAKANGVIAPQGWKDFEVEVEKLPLQALSPPEWISKFFSDVSATFKVNGPTDDPTLIGTFQLLDTQGAFGKGNFTGPLSGLSYDFESLQERLKLKGKIGVDGRTRVEVTGIARDFDLSPMFEQGTSLVTGTFDAKGEVGVIPSWNGSAIFEKFAITQGDWSVQLAHPVEAKVKTGEFSVKNVLLRGEETEFRCELTMNSNGKLDGVGEGSLGLRLLSTTLKAVERSEGAIHVNLRLGGTLNAPFFWGDFYLEDGLMQFKGFPHIFERLQWRGTIEQRRIIVDEFSASVGGGELTGYGEAFVGGALDASRVSMNAEVHRVELRFPEWLPTLISGEIRLLGPWSRPSLTGDLLVHRSVYTDEWDWKSQLLSIRSANRARRLFASGDEHILFGLNFRSEGDTLLLRNNIASATMRGEVSVVGSDRALGLLGRIEILRGNVTFLDNEFDVSNGVVAFTSETEIRSNFDLSAKTQVQQVEIFLDLRTDEEGIRAYLTSQPPRDETSIVALLALGVDTDELARAGGDSDVSSSVLPSVLSGPIQSKLESGLKQAKIVDTFQFVPYFSESTKTTGLKLIVGKRLFPKVRLTYSTDLFEAGADNTVRLEQAFNEHISIQGSVRDNKDEANEDVDIGFDMEFRYEF